MQSNVECIVTELCQQHDLFDVVRQGAVKQLPLLRGLLEQLLKALQATHHAGMCHLDVKLENVLVSQDFTLRLCDFGFAKQLNRPLTGVLGTQGYMAPEIASDCAEYDGTKADVFSLGVLLYIMAFGNPPFAHTKASECRFFRTMTNRRDKFFLAHPRTREAFKQGEIDVDLQSLLLQMMDPCPTSRLSVSEVAKHPFMTSSDQLSEEQVSAELAAMYTKIE